MPRLHSDPITSADLTEYLDTESDFNFELEILRMLRGMDVDCEHGGSYTDPVSGKTREFDIRARKTIDNFRVRLAIECKNIRENFPILVSCVPRQAQESYHEVTMLRDPETGDGSISRLLLGDRATTLRMSDRHSLYEVNEFVGKSTTQIGRAANDRTLVTNDSELYEKWGQCLASADDLVDEMYWDGEDEGTINFSTVFPLVVVPDGRLWITTYNEDGERISEPHAQERCSCYIGKGYSTGGIQFPEPVTLSHLEIVTQTGLYAFVEQYLANAEKITSVFPGAGITTAIEQQANG